MLIRFTVKNLLSFGKEKEFNMLPNPKYTRMNEHKYKLNDFNYLKLASIYGANGAGKSNLVKLLELLQEIVIKDDFSINISKKKFKLTNNNDNDSQIFAVEFIQEQRIFYYAIEIKNNIFITEELYETDLLKSNDKLIFERKTTDDGKTTINFSKEFESDKESLVLKSVIENSLVKPQKTILKLLTTLGNRYLEDTKLAFNWFANTLIIISPNSKPVAIAHTFDVDENFREYAKEIMCSFNVGICSIISEKQNLQEFFGSNRPKGLEDIIVKLEETTDNETPGQKIVELRNQNGNEILLVKEKENVLVKQIKLEHIGLDNHKEYFGLDEESDGTIRLLDFIPAFKDIVNGNKVYVIDEIERSIHPFL
jgi:AAA15 family ATPase/GTPase